MCPTPTTRPDPADTLRVIQLSDTHLYADPHGTLLGLNTLNSLKQCVALAREHHWPPDAVLATGDLVHDGSAEGYRRLRRILEGLEVPVYAIPGNHDSAQMPRALTGRNIVNERRLLGRAWQIVLLDSRIPDSEAGALADGQLQHLERCLATHPRHHALVCLHHPPVAIGSPWMDTMRLQNPEPFFRTLDRHRQVRAVLWGHVHQEFRDERNGVALIASPSTCIQFKPRSVEFALDARPPGYRWLELRADGCFDTGVQRLAALPENIDMQSTGY